MEKFMLLGIGIVIVATGVYHIRRKGAIAAIKYENKWRGSKPQLTDEAIFIRQVIGFVLVIVGCLFIVAGV